jgi:hypothetical protein
MCYCDGSLRGQRPVSYGQGSAFSKIERNRRHDRHFLK